MSTLLTFEELAFRSALEAHPGDQTAAKAYVDWLMEHGGRSPMDARREVVRLRRDYAEEKQFQRITLVMANGSKALAVVQAEFAKRFRVRLHQGYLWTFEKGGGSPRLENTEDIWRDGRGRAHYSPGEAHRRGGPVEHVPGVARVVLPAAWVDQVLRECGYYGNLSTESV